MPRPPLSDVQLQVLRATAEGRVLTDAQKVSARALENRQLVVVSRRAGGWSVQLTADGEHYLRHNRYPDPPPVPAPPSTPKSTGPTLKDRIAVRQEQRRARTGGAAPPIPRSSPTSPPPTSPASRTHLEPMSMRYRIVISRVQTAERHVRAATEDEALAKVRAELDKPYGFLGGWTTIDTDLDVVEAVNPLPQPAQQIVGKDGAFLLSIKATAAYLGLSYSTVYDMVNTGEISHVVVGTRRYISRDQLTAFIDGHSHTGGNYGLRR